MTLAELKKRVGNLLGILEVGATLNSQDDTRIGAAYTETYEQLKTEGLNVWGSTIPNKVANHMVAICALNCVDDYGVSNDRYQRIVAKANIALREIRKHATPEYQPLDDPEDF